VSKGTFEREYGSLFSTILAELITEKVVRQDMSYPIRREMYAKRVEDDDHVSPFFCS